MLVNPSYAKNSDRFIMGFFALFFAALLFVVSYFGNPIGDESFPMAMALRFIQGQKPFIDDLSPFIGMGLFLVPLLKLSLFLHHGKDELFLFTRHAFICFEVGLGIYLYFCIRKRVPAFLAGFFALFVAAYHPFGIHNFHYDTLAVSLWCVVLFQSFMFTFKQETSFWQYALYGFFNLLLCLIYPTFVVLLLPLFLLCHVRSRNKFNLWLSAILLFALSAGFLAWLVFGYYRVRYIDLLNSTQYSSHIFMLGGLHKSVAGKFMAVTQQLLNMYSTYLMHSFCCVAFAYLLRKHLVLRSVLLLLPLVLPLFHISVIYATYSDSFYFFNCVGFLGAMVFLLFLRADPLARKLFYSIWLPALAAGFLTGMSSSNPNLNFSLGFFPCVLLGFAFVYLVLASRAVLIYGFVMLAFFTANYVYGSEEIGINQYLMSKKYLVNGPFRGIYLDYYWYDNLESLQAEVKKIDTDPAKFIYFGPLSGGYLLTDYLKPGEYILFGFYRLGHFGKPVRTPSYIVFDHSRAQNKPEEALRKYLEGTLNKKVVSKQNYDIYFVSK